jgi:predicted metal-dependent phosphoesterase TrpH
MIDLHSHTDQSDGTFTPEELVAEAVRVGLKALAITDHDTFRGHDMAAPLAEKAGLELICGIELSTRFGGASVHLLSYFPSQPPTAEFRAWLIERLQALGVDITLEEVEQKGRTLTARPHFARTLVEKGYAANIQDAFDKYLDESAKGYVQRQEVPIAEAIERVIAAGGVASMAHPVRVAKNNWDTLAEYAGSMSRMGMQAIEVFHSDHTPENVAYYQSLANRFGLGVTGGSDFHGGNKPLISLGTGLRGNLNVPDSVLDGLKSLV